MNEQLRQHVTNQSFVLTMRKTHILAMVANPETRVPHFPAFLSGLRGCKERGLVMHHPPPGIVCDLPFGDFGINQALVTQPG